MSDRYEFIRKIAQGGFGRVYVAKDTRLGRDVAIKRLLSPEESASYDQAQATFEREATTLAALQHPNIVQVYDFDRDMEGTFVVMEMLEGETLKDRLTRGPLVWETFVMVVRQALDAINAAHSIGVLHRDLKPENLFLHRTAGGTRVLKVLDFGLAKLSNVPSRQTMDQSGNVFGSIYYMAPEQFVREPLDGRTDLYALGCVFYQALTSRYPFHGENMQGTMEAHMSHQVRHLRERRPDLSVPVCDWVMRMIAQKPGDRPADAMAAMREFEAALEGRVLQPAPKGPAAQPAAGRPPSSQPVPARMAAAASSARGAAPAAGGKGGRSSTPATARPSGATPAPGAMKSPMQNRPVSALEAARAEAMAKLKASGKRTRLGLYVGVSVVVVVLALFALMRHGSPAPAASAAVETPASNASAGPGVNPAVAPSGAATSPEAAKAGANPLALPDALPLALPMEFALTWRFRAGAGWRHRNPDGKMAVAKLQRGQTVSAWRNLASPDAGSGLYPYQGKGERSPLAGSAEVPSPGVGVVRSVVGFGMDSGLTTRLKPEELAKAPGSAVPIGANDPVPPGATVALVFRANALSKEKLMRPLLLTSADAKQHVSLHCSHSVGQYWVHAEREGRVAQSLVSPEAFAKQKDGAGANWVIALLVWDGGKGTVCLRVRTPDGKTVTGPSSAIPAGMAALDRLSVGLGALPADSQLDVKEAFEGDILEVAVYRRALDEAMQDKVLSALSDGYFARKPAAGAGAAKGKAVGAGTAPGAGKGAGAVKPTGTAPGAGAPKAPGPGAGAGAVKPPPAGPAASGVKPTGTAPGAGASRPGADAGKGVPQ